MQDAVSEAELEALANVLASLAHPRRLELLALLRQPLPISEIELKPWRRSPEHNPDRAISRSAVERHLQTLETIGVVSRRSAPRGKGGDEFVLDHARLFATIESVRALTKLRPSIDLESRETLAAQRGTVGQRKAAGGAVAQVVVLGGPREGEAIPLAGPGPWGIGRSASAQVRLDYDPFVSSRHAEIVRDGSGLSIQDLPANRNGTTLNWVPLARGSTEELRSGDVIGLGHSLLLLREPR